VKVKCPNCGNTSWQFIETNEPPGNKRRLEEDPDLTLLCIAPVEPGNEASADHPNWDELKEDFGGICGMQWNPNQE
jgi:hypothetical protein